MGAEVGVTWKPGDTPAWDDVKRLLAERGVNVQMRMIDGAIAFPDEAPTAEWKEIRVAGPGGMATIKREATRVRVITWGEADPALERLRAMIAWAFAQLSAGEVHSDDGTLDAEAFRQLAGL